MIHLLAFLLVIAFFIFAVDTKTKSLMLKIFFYPLIWIAGFVIGQTIYVDQFQKNDFSYMGWYLFGTVVWIVFSIWNYDRNWNKQ